MPLRSAKVRTAEMPDLFADAGPVPVPKTKGTPTPAELEPTSLAEARAEAKGCMRCPLYEDATQTVFGEGADHATIMLVGEQPGDQEDLQGHPFVGPAGQMLDRAMAEAGMDREKVFVTNAVKHFKFERRGKKRIHQKPNNGEVDICRWWLDLERRFVKPRVVVALGGTAIRGVTGRSSSVTSLRGRPTELPDGVKMVTTVHPSYLLRMPDRNAAEVEFGRLVDDLKLALKVASG